MFKIYNKLSNLNEEEKITLLKGLRMCIMENMNTHRRRLVRTNVVIDDDLMESALRASGTKTKKAAIEQGLKLLVKLKSQERIKGFRGKLKWTGNLDEMRLDK
jgi:Arc/MetJ family transcription regulator